MPLIRDGRVVANDWIEIEDGAPPVAGGPVLVSLARWRAERETLSAGGGRIGVRVAGGESIADLVADLPRLSLIAIEFPTVTDGRGYTLGRLLRERHGFAGEMRAVGDIVRDVYPFLHRCGFDAVEAKTEGDAAAWAEALAAVAVAYQPAADGKTPVWALRQRRAQGAPSAS